jgi:hypothetical protein
MAGSSPAMTKECRNWSCREIDGALSPISDKLVIFRNHVNMTEKASRFGRALSHREPPSHPRRQKGGCLLIACSEQEEQAERLMAGHAAFTWPQM